MREKEVNPWIHIQISKKKRERQSSALRGAAQCCPLPSGRISPMSHENQDLTRHNGCLSTQGEWTLPVEEWSRETTLWLVPCVRESSSSWGCWRLLSSPLFTFSGVDGRYGMKFNQVILRHPLFELRGSKRLAPIRSLKTFDNNVEKRRNFKESSSNVHPWF